MRWFVLSGVVSAVAILHACTDARIGLGDDGPPQLDAGDGGPRTDAEPDGDAGSDLPATACRHGDPFGEPRLVPGFEERDVWSGRLAPDELTIYLSIPLTPASAAGFDIYTAGRFTRTGAFGPLTKLSISTPGDDYWPTTSDDQKVMFFESGQNPDGGDPVGSRVWFATRDTVPGNFTSTLWDYFKAVPENATEGSPYLSPSGKTLYWQSIGRSTFASVDLWAADVTTAGTVASDYRLAGTINTDTEAETFPVISSDDLELFFARMVGVTPEDMWLSQRTSPSDGFGRVDKVQGPAINTAAGEWPSWISPDHCRLYFVRTRPIDAGMEARLWVAERQKR